MSSLRRQKGQVLMRSSFLVFGAPCFGNEELEAVAETIRGGWVGTGPRAAAFEQAFWAYKREWGVPVAVSSCTAALHISLIAAGLEPGAEVITTPLTFCATVNAIAHANLTPVVADVDARTLNISPEEIERKITPKTRAIVPVHFAGRPCDMDSIMDIARRHRLTVVEDCAHAVETTYKGQPAGTFGDFSCFSFYVTKNITTGEGGMILARTAEAAERCRILALHGMSKDAWKRFSDEGFKHYQVVECGFKYNMVDSHAAMGLEQLKKIGRFRQARESIWRAYNSAFAELPIKLPPAVDPDTEHAFHLYTIQVDASRAGISRDRFLNAMTSRNIGVGVHYTCLTEHPYYQQTFGWRPEDTPVAAAIGRTICSLPISPKLNSDDVADVISAVTEILSEHGR